MISKKQEEDEQHSDLLQTVWSENNIIGKERLHAHVVMKREKLTLQMKIFHCLILDILSFPPLGSIIQINIVIK